MNTLRDFLNKLASGGLPAWALAGAGIVLLLLAMKAAKGLLKLVFVVLALAALAGAVWWYLKLQSKI